LKRNRNTGFTATELCTLHGILMKNAVDDKSRPILVGRRHR